MQFWIKAEAFLHIGNPTKLLKALCIFIRKYLHIIFILRLILLAIFYLENKNKQSPDFHVELLTKNLKRDRKVDDARVTAIFLYLTACIYIFILYIWASLQENLA